MTVKQGLWADLNTSLQQDLTITGALEELLTKERHALETRNYNDFNEQLNDKKHLLLQLDQNSKQRHQLLRQLGFQNEQETLASAAQQAPDVVSHWQALTEQWQQCQEMNEINERISQRTKLVVGQMLDLLRGQTGDSRTYTAKGNTQDHNNGRSITSA